MGWLVYASGGVVMASADWDASGPSAATIAAGSATLGGAGSSLTYWMRGWGTVSLAYVYWSASTPGAGGAPEAVTDVVVVRIS